jgi:hypothetical protein
MDSVDGSVWDVLGLVLDHAERVDREMRYPVVRTDKRHPGLKAIDEKKQTPNAHGGGGRSRLVPETRLLILESGNWHGSPNGVII